MIEYEKIPFRKFPKNRHVSVNIDEFQEYLEMYLQYQHFKDLENIRAILRDCSSDQPLSWDDIYDIFGVILNTPHSVGVGSSDKYPMTDLPYFYVDEDDETIRNLIDKYRGSDNTNLNRKDDEISMENQSSCNKFDFDEEAKHPKFYKKVDTTEYDVVKKPEHYNYSSIQPKDAIRAWGLNFNLGSAVKYIARAGHKDDIIQDLSKAIQFIQFELDYYRGYILEKNCDSIVMNEVSEKILDYIHYINDESIEYRTPVVIMEWKLIDEKQPLGCAIDYIHMFHYVGGCDNFLTKAIDNIQYYIDQIKKERVYPDE